MNRDQARVILRGLHLGAGDEERRVAAIDVVMDLLEGGPARIVFPGNFSMDEANAEIERLRRVAQDQERNLVSWTQLWRRIKELVGREFATPVSVVDRIASLVEQEKATKDQLAGLAAQRERLQSERDDLLAAARYIIEHTDSGQWLDLRELVERIDNNAREDT